MAVDGYLNFDTKINTKGFAKGVKALNKQFISSATDVKAAFDMVYSSISRVTASFSRLTDAYRTQIESEARLGATMKNSTSASSAQIESVKELASSLQELGVVGDEVQLAGAQKLATYVGQTESIKKMLPVLNDMIAQQYGYSASTDSAVTIATMLGKVLQGQTSALSRYGYKFDENQEKLLKFGTEEQRVATLAAVVEESVSGVNAALAGTPTGRVKQLENDFGDLKETMGKLLTETVYPLVVKLDVVVKKLNEIFTAASTGIKSVFGIKGDVSVGGMTQSTAELDDSASDAADSYADMADSAKKAEKANKGSLAAFDELNVLAREDVSDDDSGVFPQAAESAEALTAGLDTSAIKEQVDELFDTISSKWQELFSPIKKAWEENGKPVVENIKGIFSTIKKHVVNIANSLKEWWIDTNLSPVLESFNGFLESIKSLLDSVGDDAEWFVKNVIEPLGKWTIEEALPTALDVISSFLTLVNKIGDKVGDALKSLWENFFAKAADFVGDAIITVFSGIAQVLRDIAANDTAVTTLTVIVELVGSLILSILTVRALFMAGPAIIAALTNPLTLVVIAIAAIIVVIVELITYWDILKEAWIEGVKTWQTHITNFWEKLKNGAQAAWEGVKYVFSKVANFFGDVFSKAWNKVKEIFSKGGEIFKGIKEGIVTAFKAIVNSLIDGINRVVAIPFEGINNALSTLRDVEIAGFTPFDWLPEIDIPQIPHLAQGKVIPANYGEFAAILGDNKRETEIVSPVSAMKQAFLEALAESGIAGGSSNDGDNVINIDGREIFRIVKRHADDYSRTHGGRPAFGGT